MLNAELSYLFPPATQMGLRPIPDTEVSGYYITYPIRGMKKQNRIKNRYQSVTLHPSIQFPLKKQEAYWESLRMTIVL